MARPVNETKAAFSLIPDHFKLATNQIAYFEELLGLALRFILARRLVPFLNFERRLFFTKKIAEKSFHGVVNVGQENEN